MRLEGEDYQAQAIREYNESAEAKGHDRIPSFADVDDYRDELKYNGVICEETGRKVLPCPHDTCPKCCLRCFDETKRHVAREYL